MDSLCLIDHNRDATMAGGCWGRMASGICENGAGFSESVVHKTSFSPVFWVLVNLISPPIPHPPPINYLSLFLRLLVSSGDTWHVPYHRQRGLSGRE